MRLLSAPRQPFVGLAVTAAIGIIVAELSPLSALATTPTTIVVAVCAVALLCWPKLAATYLIVGVGFFLLHDFQTTNTEGQRLAAQLGDRPRTLAATGYVISEPKAHIERIHDVFVEARII